MIGHFFVILFVVFPVALLLVACVLLALWLAFGKTNLFFRMPIFLAATLPIGLICSLAESRRLDGVILVLGITGFTYGIFCRIQIAAKILMGIMLGLMALIVFASPIFNDWHDLNTAWMVRIAFGTSGMAAVFASLRLLGFNVAQLVKDSNDIEMEQHTGRTLDQWLIKLRSAGAAAWNHAEIMAFLRTFGMDFSWQKKITLAYRKTRGQLAIGTAPDGGRQVVAQTMIKPTKPSSTFSYERLGIWQLMLITFCVACLFRFTDGVSKFLPSKLEIAIGTALCLCVSALVIGLMRSSLAVGRYQGRKTVLVFIAFGTVCGLFYGLETWVGNQFHVSNTGFMLTPVFAILMFEFATISSLFFVQARNRNYRIVRVQRTPEPKSTLIKSVEDWEKYQASQREKLSI